MPLDRPALGQALDEVACCRPDDGFKGCFAETPVRPLRFASDNGVSDQHSQTNLAVSGEELDDVHAVLETLSAGDADILCLVGQGFKDPQIAWMLDVSMMRVKAVKERLDQRIAPDLLVAAGLMTAARQQALKSRYGRLLATGLRGIVGARIGRVIVDETHCGLELVLLTGHRARLFFCADEEMEKPGWACIEDAQGEAADICAMMGLAKAVQDLCSSDGGNSIGIEALVRDISHRSRALLDAMATSEKGTQIASEDFDVSHSSFLELVYPADDDQPIPDTAVMSVDPPDLHTPDHALTRPQSDFTSGFPKSLRRDEQLSLGQADAQETPQLRRRSLDTPPDHLGIDLDAARERLRSIGQEVACMPEHHQGFARVYHHAEVQFLVSLVGERSLSDLTRWSLDLPDSTLQKAPRLYLPAGSHPMHKTINAILPSEGYRMQVEWSDGDLSYLEFEQHLGHVVFFPLQRWPKLFFEARIDASNSYIFWPDLRFAGFNAHQLWTLGNLVEDWETLRRRYRTY